MITIKRLSECTLQQAVDVWNGGFEGYYFPMTTNVLAFTQRLASEGLSPEHSVVAFTEGRPIGFVLNGIRMINGKKVAWNGGTGVIPEYRNKGVGRELMKATLDIYRTEQVNLALLEAISANEKAIKLYQQMGYDIIDKLHFYYHQGSLLNEEAKQSGQESDYSNDYSYVKGIPQDVRTLPFYRSEGAWQTQWASVRDGESLIVRDNSGQDVAYAVYKRTFDESGKQTGIILYQAEVFPELANGRTVLEQLLNKLYGPFRLPYLRSTVNTPVSNELLSAILLDWGFTSRAEQVLMAKHMD